MQTSLGRWGRGGRPRGVLGGVLFVFGLVTVLALMAVLVASGLVLMALVGLAMGGERLLGWLVPAYGRRRRQRYLTMPPLLIRTVRFRTGPTEVIEASSSELPPHGP